MSAMEKSDLPEVARKRANNAASAAAEPVERRGGAKENAKLQSTVRTQSREAVSRAQARIREAVTRNRQDKLTALLMANPQREIEQRAKAVFERCVALDLAAKVADDAAKPRAQKLQFPPRAFELVGMRVAPHHDGGTLG